jgi:hypothetical protein
MTGPRKTAILFESVHRLLDMYAIAVVVALLSVLALTECSEAEIVYTPVNVQLGTYSLDLNNDGITDFTLELNYYSESYTISYRLTDLAAQQGNGVVPDGNGLAAVLSRGVEIGPDHKFTSPQLMAYVWQDQICSPWPPKCHLQKGENGLWLNVSNGYLGLKFQIKGKTHYGWARLSVHSSEGYGYQIPVSMEATLTGYAYETVAGKSIKAGQTKGAAYDWEEDEDFGDGASLSAPVLVPLPTAWPGLLALVAQDVPLLRGKESALEGDRFLVRCLAYCYGN